MIILLLRKKNTWNTLDLRLAEVFKQLTAGTPCEMEVQWKVLRYPSWRLCQCTVTFIAPWQLFELWTGWEGIWTSLQGTARPPTKNNKTHTSNMEPSRYRVDLSIDTWKKLNKNKPYDRLIDLQLHWTGDKISDMKHVPSHLRPQKVQG